MVTSLFEHERIVTTRAKGKVLRSYAEKLITRAKSNLSDDIKPEQSLHNKREVMRHVFDRDIVVKLFEEIAPRYKERSGGYTRLIHLPDRNSDSSKMSIVELVDRKEKKKAKPKAAAAQKPSSKTTAKQGEQTEAKAKGTSGKKKDDKKWFDRFRKKKG